MGNKRSLQSNDFQRGITTILIILLLVIVFIVFGFMFLASPHKVAGNPIQPFKEGEYFLSEKITFLFRKPEIGDRVVFSPTTTGVDYLGIVTKIEENNNVTTYKIVSGAKGTEWTVSPEKITARIYFPVVSDKEIESVLSSLPQQTSSTPITSPNPSAPSDETANWKTYTDNETGFTFKYPLSWEIITQIPTDYTIKGCKLYLQNQQEKSSVIVIDISEKMSDGGYCWSNGYFYDYRIRQITTLQKSIEVSKWRRDKDPLWKGEWFQFYSIDGNKNDATIALIYKDKKDNTAEPVFDQILPTFKFIN